MRIGPALLACPVLAIAFTLPARAEVTVTFPVSIPHECVELAQREGVPVVIENRYQAAKARIKLARLKDSDPMVRECRAAVARAREAAGERAKAAVKDAPAREAPAESVKGPSAIE